MAIINLSEYVNPNSVERGYIFECCCGERFRSVRWASTCKKCRNYSVWGYTKYVIDIITGDVVHGNFPTTAEYEAQEALAAAGWEEEKRQFEAMLRRDEEECTKLKDAAVKRAAEANEDELHVLQDKLMGY
jgi:hypothetical protein